ncbi:MAG: NTP transferase domain-containing protein [Ferroplasma sp.]|uniref:molybdenum cofactor guanylyltransferase n=1 Tax=Ferroplasma sp. TaxID=2591003 RepID=UPI0028155705|nr:NTP transferase domain-containing protein [Ferroplasma sp.]WMT51006.1 MAG: NTP transferase domain-containing protein [Ferroplasma sp.]
MIAIVFAKKSQRLMGKHRMDLCGEPLIERVSRIILQSSLFDEIILFTKDPSVSSKYCRTEYDATGGILIDSILYCIEKYRRFLAVGGDMPYIDASLIRSIISNYHGEAIACISGGFYQPLFTIYTEKLYKSMKEYRNSGGESISRFLSISGIETIDVGGNQLQSINYISDLYEARRLLCGGSL